MADHFKACSILGCNGNAHWRHKGARGWCVTHYKRWFRHGDPLGGGTRVDNSGGCSIDGCENTARTMGMCNAHYLRFRAHGDLIGGGTLRGSPGKYFRDVVLPYRGAACLIWPYSRNAGGYGTMFAKKGVTTIVARRACEEVNGHPPSKEYHAAHKCGNGHLGCVASSHVEWKLPIDNSDDKMTHGTMFKKARGSLHPSSKLTESEVRQIRAGRGAETAGNVADRYGVKVETIKAIYAGRTWRHLK